MSIVNLLTSMSTLVPFPSMVGTSNDDVDPDSEMADKGVGAEVSDEEVPSDMADDGVEMDGVGLVLMLWCRCGEVVSFAATWTFFLGIETLSSVVARDSCDTMCFTRPSANSLLISSDSAVEELFGAEELFVPPEKIPIFSWMDLPTFPIRCEGVLEAPGFGGVGLLWGLCPSESGSELIIISTTGWTSRLQNVMGKVCRIKFHQHVMFDNGF